MLGFIRLSPQLLQQLKSSEILLYYAIEHFHFSDKGCYASNKTLMRISGIGCNRKFAAIKRRLIDGGYITEINGVRYTLFERGGVGILKSFLFSSEYSSTEKVYNILRFLKPRETKIELAKRIQVSCRTLQRCSVVPFASFVVQTKPQSRVGQIHIPSNDFKQLINNTTCENLFGEKVAIPENTDPVVIQELHLEEEKKITEEENRISEESIKQISFDLFDKRAAEAELLYQDLRRIFPRVADKPLWQSIWQAVQNERKIKGTLLGYAIGILKPFFKTFPDKKIIPTIADTDNILLSKKRALQDKNTQNKMQKERDLKELEDSQKIASNQDFYSQLSATEKDQLRPFICSVGNPYNLPFITETMTLRSAYSQEDFIQESLKILSERGITNDQNFEKIEEGKEQEKQQKILHRL